MARMEFPYILGFGLNPRKKVFGHGQNIYIKWYNFVLAKFWKQTSIMRLFFLAKEKLDAMRVTTICLVLLDAK